MPDYKETAVTGKKWQRCNVVHIDNPYQAQPTVTLPNRRWQKLMALLSKRN